MTETQRMALTLMVEAILRVSHIDEFTAARAYRLLGRLQDRTVRPNWRFVDPFPGFFA
jgi:hypothetical protein